MIPFDLLAVASTKGQRGCKEGARPDHSEQGSLHCGPRKKRGDSGMRKSNALESGEKIGPGNAEFKLIMHFSKRTNTSPAENFFKFLSYRSDHLRSAR